MSAGSQSEAPESGRFIGRYRVERELGRGGMASVLEVTDTESDKRVALKLMHAHRTQEEFVNRFRREYRTLSRLTHPNILRVYESGTWGELPYYTMEFVAGRELKDEVEQWKELGPAERFRRAERVLVQIARALEFIHGRGLIHRDVTPSNIMILADGTAKLMDFGVVHDPGTELTVDGQMIGTVAYMAPEQVSKPREVDGRADLYSLGAVLYLMLCGRRPFNSRTLGGYLSKKLNDDPRPPRELYPTLPEKLDRVCMTLLRRNPEERFASARHLLRVLEGDRERAHRTSTSGSSWSMPLVGRAREVSQVREVVGRLRGGRGGVVVIEGETGFGKSRVATELEQQARRVGIPVHREANTGPDQPQFFGFRSIYEALRGRVAIEAAQSATLEATFVSEDQAEPPERWVVLEAFRKVLGGAGKRVLILDNLDLADRGTAELTEYLARNLVGVDGASVLLVVTREIESLGSGHRGDLAGLVDGSSTGVVPVRIVLAPLSVSAVEELLLSFIEDHPRLGELAVRLQREGAGNAYLISEMIWGLVDQGLIELGKGGGAGRLSDAAFDSGEITLPVPSSLGGLLRERLTPLSLAARTVAVVLAVGRNALDIELLRAGADLTEDSLEDALDELIAAGLVNVRDTGEAHEVELSLIRLRDVVIEEAPRTQQVRINRRLGELLEQRHRGKLAAVHDLLGHYFEQGELKAKAYQYLYLAAQRQLSRGYRREALALVDRALALEGRARSVLMLGEADRILTEVLLCRTQALLHLGRWQEAEEAGQEALELAEALGHDWLLAKCMARLTQVARFTRGPDEAEQLAKRALGHARDSGDPSLEIAPLFYLGGTHWTRGDTATARRLYLEGLARAETGKDERSLAQGYVGLGILAICRGEIVEARKHLQEAFVQCERHGLVETLAVAGCNLVELHHFSGNLRKGIELAERIVTRTREVQYPFGIALGLRYRALMLVDLGRLEEAEETAREALRMLQELGDKRTEFETLVILLRVALAKGTLDEALMEQALELGRVADDEGFVPVLLAWRGRILADRGRDLEAKAMVDDALRRSGGAWPHQRVRVLLNAARVHQQLSHDAEARELAEHALRISDSHGFRYYAMRARQILVRVSDEEAFRARNQRVADALAKSLAANLAPDDAASFLSIQQLGSS